MFFCIVASMTLFMVGLMYKRQHPRGGSHVCFWMGHNFMRVLIAILFSFTIGPSWAEQAIIVDGDTLILSGIPYRLDGIDAPETDQVCLNEKRNVWACGLEARDQLSKFVRKRDVRCDSKGFDTVYR